MAKPEGKTNPNVRTGKMSAPNLGNNHVPPKKVANAAGRETPSKSGGTVVNHPRSKAGIK